MNPNLPPPPASYRASHAVIGRLMNILGISCRSAYELSSAQMDRTLRFSEKFRLLIHLTMCSICRHLPAQFRGLRKLIQAACQHEPHDEPQISANLPEETKTRIHDHLKNSNHH